MQFRMLNISDQPNTVLTMITDEQFFSAKFTDSERLFRYLPVYRVQLGLFPRTKNKL